MHDALIWAIYVPPVNGFELAYVAVELTANQVEPAVVRIYDVVAPDTVLALS